MCEACSKCLDHGLYERVRLAVSAGQAAQGGLRFPVNLLQGCALIVTGRQSSTGASALLACLQAIQVGRVPGDTAACCL